MTAATAVRERGITFGAPMVRALRQGRKTQTRRLLTWKPREEGTNLQASSLKLGYYHSGAPECGWVLRSMGGSCWNDRTYPALCPQGKVGDRLYVREAWRTGKRLDSQSPAEIGAACIEAGYTVPGAPILYEADGEFRPWGDNDREDFGEAGRYRHARFMPRWASRITLGITEVRAQQLQEISEADARAEGCEPWAFGDEQCMTSGERGAASPYRGGFACLWDEINDERAPWFSNPFVWAISFRRIERC